MTKKHSQPDYAISTIPPLTPYEKTTLFRIAQEIPKKLRQRYRALVRKRRAETLTEAEHVELISLSDRIEGIGVKRLQYLAQLAEQRHVSLTTMLEMTQDQMETL